jgi:branched-chain amino acid transport system permease protein
MKRGFVGATLLAIVLVIIGLITTYFGSRYQLRLVYSTYVNLLVVLGLQVFMGNARITNLSHSAFMGIGAYVAAICVTPVNIKALSLPNAPWGLNAFSLDPLPSALIAIAITGTVALLVGLMIVRLSGIGATIVSLAFLVIVHSLFLYRTDIFKGNQAFFGIPQVFNLASVIALSAAVVFAVRIFRESKWGVALRASADDEVGALSMGVEMYWLRLIAWVFFRYVACRGRYCICLLPWYNFSPAILFQSRIPYSCYAYIWWYAYSYRCGFRHICYIAWSRNGALA